MHSFFIPSFWLALNNLGKTVGDDKKLYKSLESKYVEEIESEIPDISAASPFGPLTQQASRKTLYHLIATLNASFPDYDFRLGFTSVLCLKLLSIEHTPTLWNSNAKAENFTKQPSLPLVVNSINNSLTYLGEAHPDLVQKLWTAIDSETNLSDRFIFSHRSIKWRPKRRRKNHQ